MLCSSRWIGSSAGHPACLCLALAARRQSSCSFFVHSRESPAAERLAPGIRMLSTSLSPRIGGNLAAQRNPFSELWSADDGSTLSSMPPAAVCPRVFHRVIHRQSMNSGRIRSVEKSLCNHPQSITAQKMNRCLEALHSKGSSEVPPCFPQAVPHYPWKT